MYNKDKTVVPYQELLLFIIAHPHSSRLNGRFGTYKIYELITRDFSGLV
jgi:hypothetical protein